MCQYFWNTNIHKAPSKQPKMPSRTTWIMMTPWKQLLKMYLSNQESYAQDVVCHIFPELKLRRIFSSIYVVNPNLPEKNVSILLSEKELIQLPDNSPNNFRKSNWLLHWKTKCNILQWKIQCFKQFLSCKSMRLVNISQMN